ncbi:hypothetical protein [Streptomyces sp. NPDC058371]|jgi:hypothetical protein|uniref:hypothetical protein n=1 Tax=Streptomyces sp. NPDC058371 TaxID=3346463 RepID=UPI0036522F75
MGFVTAVLAVLLGVVVRAVVLLVRRDRRRFSQGHDSARIEAYATRGIREARRKAHAYDRFAGSAGVGALRDRDGHGDH